MRFLAVMAMSLVLAGEYARSQTTNMTVSTATNATPALAKAGDEKAWSFSLSAYTYIVADSREYVQPTVTADRDWLHVEGRYNYEALNTGSAWLGCNFSGGEKLAWEFTPMLGGVFGDTSGVAPGYKGSLGWWKLELYSEGEYVRAVDDRSGTFFYTWSELTMAPVDWFHFGMVVQRTKLYETEFDIQRGLLAGFTFKKVDFTAYVFNPDASRPTIVLELAFSF